jgi:hypothetical protein
MGKIRHKITSLVVLSRIFPKQVSADINYFRFRWLCALHIQNLSNCCRHKYNLTISRVFKFIFWRIFAIWLYYVQQRRPARLIRSGVTGRYLQASSPAVRQVDTRTCLTHIYTRSLERKKVQPFWLYPSLIVKKLKIWFSQKGMVNFFLKFWI